MSLVLTELISVCCRHHRHTKIRLISVWLSSVARLAIARLDTLPYIKIGRMTYEKLMRLL